MLNMGLHSYVFFTGKHGLDYVQIDKHRKVFAGAKVMGRSENLVSEVNHLILWE